MTAALDLLTPLLREPARLPELSPAQWDLLVRQARAAGLLARLAWQFQRHGLWPQLPEGAARHLDAAACVAQAQATEVRREVAHLQRVFRPLGLPLILLKGSAYLLAGLPPSHGRVFSDTDILVPKTRLTEVEAALTQHGWATTHHSAYDQRYYREWMHELPPMVHLRRQTALDVHHAIAPETARIRPDSAALIAAAVAVPGADGLAVLAPPDMVLHSMLHLLTNEELSHGLRDLSDLDLLLRHLGAEADFWDALTRRAAQLGLLRILHHATEAARAILGTPVPAAVRAATAVAAPGPALAPLMRMLWRRALRVPHPSASDWATPVALAMLYVRAHWLRMPPALLFRHLAVKAVRRRLPASADKGPRP